MGQVLRAQLKILTPFSSTTIYANVTVLLEGGEG